VYVKLGCEKRVYVGIALRETGVCWHCTARNGCTLALHCEKRVYVGIALDWKGCMDVDMQGTRVHVFCTCKLYEHAYVNG
jgi:hypothetical protein